MSRTRGTAVVGERPEQENISIDFSSVERSFVCVVRNQPFSQEENLVRPLFARALILIFALSLSACADELKGFPLNLRPWVGVFVETSLDGVWKLKTFPLWWLFRGFVVFVCTLPGGESRRRCLFS